MTKLKKSLSVLLTLVMLFTTLCFFVLPETGIRANAATGAAVSVAGNANAYNRVDDVIIVVPETIYMTPSTGASTTGQYYVNNVVDASGKVTLDVSSNADSGKLSIYAPGATSATFQVVDAKAGTTVGEPTVTGEGTAIALSNGYASKTDIKLESIATGLTAGQTATIQWNVTLTYSDKTVTYRAFTTLYAPWYYPVGSAVRVKGIFYSTSSVDARTHLASSMAWVSGVHDYTNEPAANTYAKTSGYAMVPLLYGVGSADSTTKALTDWISESKNTNTLDKATIRYSSNDSGANKYGIISVKKSPVANLAIDTSRYSNLNQIPNLTVGFNFTDNEISGSYPKGHENYWYVSDYTSKTSSSYFKDYYQNGSRDDVNNNASYYNETGATPFAGDTGTARDVSTGCEYNNLWNKEIDTSAGSHLYVLKSGVHVHTASRVSEGDAYGVNYVQLNTTNIDKSALRNLVLQATSINRANYVNDFTHFDIDIANAAHVLGNPAATAADVSTAITRLQKSTNGCNPGEHPGNSEWECPGLKIDVYARRNHASNDNYEVKHDTVVIGTNTVYSYTPSVDPDARAGYDFKGWNADRNASTGSVPANISLYATDKSVYAIWTIKQYTMTFDTKGGTAIAPITKNYGEQISAPVAPTKTGHTFAGWNVTFPYTILNNVTVTADWTVNKYIITFDPVGGSAVDSMTYDYNAEITAPADPVKTGYNFKGWSPALPEKMPANNLPVSAVWEANNYTITYDLNTDGVDGAALGAGVTSYTIEDTVTLPSATSTNYNFIGWEVTAVENGNWVTKLYEAGDTVSNVYGNVTLRAKWDIKKYTVNWVNWNGIVIETDTVNYGALPSFDQTAIPTKPADAEFTYTFKGWDKSLYNPVTEDITFTAQYESSTNSYTVIWYDSDGTKLSEQTYLYGETPVYPNAAPTKTDPSGRLTYTFKGWTPAIGTVEGNASYTAQYESRVNTYTVTFTYRDKDGNEKTVTIDD
ncbi:MAG: InlB B-repeat-containing protein, partial [Clostridia bacterium]|nr:InlB B-repeat-containing protein [Clostridia bacterium]